MLRILVVVACLAAAKSFKAGDKVDTTKTLPGTVITADTQKEKISDEEAAVLAAATEAESAQKAAQAAAVGEEAKETDGEDADVTESPMVGAQAATPGNELAVAAHRLAKAATAVKVKESRFEPTEKAEKQVARAARDLFHKELMSAKSHAKEDVSKEFFTALSAQDEAKAVKRANLEAQTKAKAAETQLSQAMEQEASQEKKWSEAVIRESAEAKVEKAMKHDLEESSRQASAIQEKATELRKIADMDRKAAREAEAAAKKAESVTQLSETEKIAAIEAEQRSNLNYDEAVEDKQAKKEDVENQKAAERQAITDNFVAQNTKAAQERKVAKALQIEKKVEAEMQLAKGASVYWSQWGPVQLTQHTAAQIQADTELEEQAEEKQEKRIGYQAPAKHLKDIEPPKAQVHSWLPEIPRRFLAFLSTSIR